MNLFPNALHVARREYAARTRTRTFLITTAALALVGLALALAPLLVRLISGDEAVRVGVFSSDAELRTQVSGQLQVILRSGSAAGQANYEVVEVSDAETGRADVREDELDGLLTVGRGEDADLSFDAYTDASPASPQLLAVQTAATQISIFDRLDRAGIDPSEAGDIFSPTPFEVERVDPNASADPFAGPDGAVAYVLVILTFMAVVTYGTWVATSVAEEKSSRVMELLITAASPRQLLAGKVLGTGAAGLTQYAAILVAALVGFLAQDLVAQQLLGERGGVDLEAIDLTVLIPFTLLFVPGFLLYCVLYAGLGSMASRQEDVTQATGPMLFVGMGGYFASFVAMATPDMAWVKILSLIPFFSPYLLPARHILAGNVAAWEWVVAGILMAAFLLGALWLAARIYSAGVLLYGQRPGFRAMLRAVRVAR